MSKQLRASVLALLALAVFAAAVPTPQLPAPKDSAVTEADLWGLFSPFPTREKSQALRGTAVGVLVHDRSRGQPSGGWRGGSRFAFSRDAQSYRWFEVPAADERDSVPRDVRTGERGDVILHYPALVAPTAENLVRWGAPAEDCLVEIDVNSGTGAPPDGGDFVATHMRVVEGSREYPLRVERCIAETRPLYRKYLEGQKPLINAELARLAALAEKGNIGRWVEPPDTDGRCWSRPYLTEPLAERLSGDPCQTDPQIYVSWMSEAQRLLIVYGTNALHVPIRREPPPGWDCFGVELGRAYEVDKYGRLVRNWTVPMVPRAYCIPVPCD